MYLHFKKHGTERISHAIFRFIHCSCLPVHIFRKRSNRSQENVTDRFWKRESIANNTRLQDLSGLPYITIPFDKFPIGMYEMIY